MWNQFYEKRVNSSYQDYFETRYAPFLSQILQLAPVKILEEGCGIASVSKALVKHNIECQGYDICPKIVNLAKENTSLSAFFVDDILQSNHSADLAITHGVLEHFTDNQLVTIFERYKENKQRSIHYVPLEGYSKPSYGDERLLPYTYWLKMAKPVKFGLFNQYDFWFIV